MLVLFVGMTEPKTEVGGSGPDPEVVRNDTSSCSEVNLLYLLDLSGIVEPLECHIVVRINRATRASREYMLIRQEIIRFPGPKM